MGRTVARWGFAAAACGALALNGGGIAAQATVRAFATPGPEVSMGAAFTVNVEVTQNAAVREAPRAPDLSGWAEYLGSGVSRSTTVVNGRATVAHGFQFRFRASREGTFSVPRIPVEAEGGTLRTEAFSMTVGPPGAGTTGSGSGATGAGPASEDLFVVAEVGRPPVREGEPLAVSYRLWTTVDVTSYTITGIPEMEGFWVEEVPSTGAPEVERRTRDGREYTTAVLRRVVVVPTGPGRRTLGPLAVDAQVRVRRRGGDPFDRLFGGGLFGSTVETVSVESEPVTIEVEALPAGRPQPFSGVVGRLEVRSEVDRTTVNTNDALTLSVHVTGAGNIRAVPAPVLDLPDDFEVFPPETSETVRAADGGITGTKTFEFVLIPRAPGRRTLPGIRYGYFDRGTGEYRTAEAPPLSVTVEGSAGATAGNGRGGVTQLRQDIRFIHLAAPTLRSRSGGLSREMAFWLVLLMPLIGVAGAVALRRHQERMEGDVAYARGRTAGRVARKRLAEARRLADGTDGRSFYAEVARALRGFVADKLNLAEAGMQRADLRRGLQAAEVGPGLVSRVEACLDACDRHRFAPRSAESAEMQGFLERASAIMADLDKEVR